MINRIHSRRQYLCKKWATTSLLATMICLSCGPLSAEEGKVLRAADLTDSIGVNTHMTYNDGAYANLGHVLDDLKFLGIRRIRDILPGTDSQPSLQGRDALRRMAYDHIKLNIFVPSGWTPTSIAWLRSLESSVPGAVASIEGYNEINNFPPTYEGQRGPAAAKAGQSALYETIKSDPVLKHVPVIDMTGFEMIKDPRFSYATTLAGYADVMNLHFYAQNGAQPSTWINPARPTIYRNVGSELPKVITEFGYSSKPESKWGFIGVDERSQAKGILNGLFDAARSGYDKVYLYELLDEKPDREMKELEFHFGLFTFTNEPKQAAEAIRNLTKVLADGNGARNGPGNPPAAAAPINVRLEEPDDGVPAHWLTLVKDDGSRIIALWRETPFWDRATGAPLEAPSIRATVSFGAACGSIRTYDLLQSSEPIAVNKGDSVSIGIADHVQLVECGS